MVLQAVYSAPHLHCFARAGARLRTRRGGARARGRTCARSRAREELPPCIAQRRDDD